MNDNELDGYYQDRDSRLNTILAADSELWIKITRSKDDFAKSLAEGDVWSMEKFSRWLIDNYGIKLSFSDGVIDLKVEIIDEHKLTIFLLKY
jgi:hypothetical protein